MFGLPFIEKLRLAHLQWVIVGVISLFALLTAPSTVAAGTVYETSISSASLEVDFASCPDSTCRANQPYVSFSEYIPQGTTFDTIRIKFTGTGASSATKMRAYLVYDEDNKLGTCATSDTSCWNDLASGYTLNLGSSPFTTTVQSDGWQSYAFSQIAATTTQQYVYVSIDPNTPYQTERNIQLANDGYNQNGYSNAGDFGSYVFQLCSGTCDTGGDWTLGNIATNPIEFLNTRFTSLSLS